MDNLVLIIIAGCVIALIICRKIRKKIGFR